MPSSSILPEIESAPTSTQADLPPSLVGTVLPTAHDALFAQHVAGLIIAIAEDEFPFQGTAAWLDWLLRGSLSGFHRQGVISGREGELTYLPVQHRDQTLHLLLVGVGRPRQAPPRTNQLASRIRRPLEAAEGKRLSGVLSGLGVRNWGLSHADFPGTSDEILTDLENSAGNLTLFD